MNELEILHAQLMGIRAQVNAALAQLGTMIERAGVAEPEPEQEAKTPPRTFGSKPKPEK